MTDRPLPDVDGWELLSLLGVCGALILSEGHPGPVRAELMRVVMGAAGRAAGRSETLRMRRDRLRPRGGQVTSIQYHTNMGGGGGPGPSPGASHYVVMGAAQQAFELGRRQGRYEAGR